MLSSKIVNLIKTGQNRNRFIKTVPSLTFNYGNKEMRFVFIVAMAFV